MIDAIPYLQKILRSFKRTNFLCGGQEKHPTVKQQVSARRTYKILITTAPNIVAAAETIRFSSALFAE
jgi:hypothetical protein